LRDEAYTVKIGSGNTAANYTLLSQIQVLPLLRKFLVYARKEHLSHVQT
jgi:trehalose 6-phosphate synthase/phosphatase